MADGFKLDVSGVISGFPSTDISDYCSADKESQSYKEVCKAFIKFATTQYSTAERQLRKLIDGKGYYLDGKKIDRLEDICPNIARPNFSANPVHVSNTSFASLDACRKKIERSVFAKAPSEPPKKEKIDEETHRLAASQCLDVTLTERNNAEATAQFQMPVGKSFKNCINATFPLQGRARLLNVYLPDGYDVEGPAGFVSKGIESSRRIYIMSYLNAGAAQQRTFEIKIRPFDNNRDDNVINVFLWSVDIPALP